MIAINKTSMFDQAMTVEEERETRDTVFHLLKKYTSYTFLDEARRQCHAFLDAFAAQLSNPAGISLPLPSRRIFDEKLLLGVYESDYRAFLKEMMRIEEGLERLRSGAEKCEAYRFIAENRFGELLFERAVTPGGDSDPFYALLGFGKPGGDESQFSCPSPPTHRKAVLKVQRAAEVFRMLYRTAFGAEWSSQPQGEMPTAYWTFESFFERYEADGPYWPPISCPLPLARCPGKTTDASLQVWNGQTIPVTGIWEPWLTCGTVSSRGGIAFGNVLHRLAGRFDARKAGAPQFETSGEVGCPNYFLAGSMAVAYEAGGSGGKAPVGWRLLWEDRRYLDSSIPEEEAAYAEPRIARTPGAVLAVRPGEPCPTGGEWLLVTTEGRRMSVEEGEPMPGIPHGLAAEAIWLLAKDEV